MSIEITVLEKYSEFLEVQKLHQVIWGLPEGGGMYPPLLFTASKSGGLVLGAALDGVLIGFLFGFLGKHTDGRIKLCSQTMGILPEYRNLGIGSQLKWFQRAKMLEAGIDLITWTFDPLEAPNAKLNLHKLGGIVDTYLVNIYGENFTALGSGLPSDRFLVIWHLSSDHVLARVNTVEQTSPIISKSSKINTCRGKPAKRCIDEVDLMLENKHLIYEIPPNFQVLRKNNPDLAAEWRFQTRQVFQHYFSKDYRVLDLININDIPHYLLSGKISQEINTEGDN